MAHDILIIDDEPDIRLLIEGILSDEGYETRGAGDSDAALIAFRQRQRPRPLQHPGLGERNANRSWQRSHHRGLHGA